MAAFGITDAEYVDDNDKQIKKSIGFEKRDLIIGEKAGKYLAGAWRKVKPCGRQ